MIEIWMENQAVVIIPIFSQGMTKYYIRMIGKNRLSLKNNQLKFESVGNLLIRFRGIYRKFIPQFNEGSPEVVHM